MTSAIFLMFLFVYHKTVGGVNRAKKIDTFILDYERNSPVDFAILN